MTIYNFYTIRELAPQQHECFPGMNFGYNNGRIKNRIYLPDTFVGATYYFDGEFSNRYGASQLDEQGHPYIDINFNNGEIGNGTVFIIAGKRYCTFRYTLEYVNLYETEIDASEIDTSNLVTKQTFDNTVERIDNDITAGDTANRTAIDQLTAATNQRFADVNAKLSGYDEQIGAVDTEVKNLASEVDGYSTDIAKAVADAADAKSVAEGAADDAATADAAAKEAQDSVSALDTRVGAVENSVETAETTANEAKSAAQTAQTTAGEAQTSAASAKSRADEAYTLAETAQSNAEGATEKAATAQSTADGVKTRVDTIEQTTIPAVNDNVKALQANMLPKTGGSMTGRLGIDPGLIPYMIGETANVYQDIMSWYTGLDANSVGIAQIRPTQAAVGLQVNWGLILACKRSDTNGVMLAMQYAGGGVLFSYVDDSGLHDFSVSGQTTAST